MHSLPLDPDKKIKKMEDNANSSKKTTIYHSNCFRNSNNRYSTKLIKTLKRKTRRSGPLSPTIAQK
jgi:hypothetical protein